MLGLTPETRVFVKTGATDLRLAFEGLRALVINVIHRDPCSGFVFAFCNRSRNRVRCLYWDGSGLWLATKRIESGTVDWPKDETGAAEMNGTQLRLLLQGLEVKSRRGWYRRGNNLDEMKNL
jgi:transposase